MLFVSRFLACVLTPIITAVAADIRPAARTPWTTSTIKGSPEAPAPFRVERAFPELTFTQPLEIAVLPGTDRLVVVEREGKLRSFRAVETTATADLFGDLAHFDPELSEAYSLTFHPKFSKNRFAYVLAIAKTRGLRNRENGTRIIRFQVTTGPAPRLDLTTGRVIITWLQGGHNGGNLRFGPDGMLYFGAGDAGPAEPPDPLVTGQDISDLLGSILRIDVDRADPGLAYAIPRDNPFVGVAKARGEVWAYGLRNPWRIAFDPASGDLYSGDVGWQLWEMIQRIQRGGNYGWSLTEGSRQDVRPDRLVGPSPVLPPLVTHSHAEAASITGGEFYHGSKLPDLRGAYIYGDWQTGVFWSLRAQGDRVTERRELCRTTLSPVGFGVQTDGEILICDYVRGGLWRLAANPATVAPSKFPRKLSETGLFVDAARQVPAPGVVPYSINVPRWADHATSERWAGFPGTSRVTIATQQLAFMPVGRWVLPNHAVLAKTYSLELERGNPATRRRVETQILHYNQRQWSAYSYRWNAAQTDAELLPSDGDTAVFDIKDSAAPGGTLRQTWRFHSRAECLRCHNAEINFTPGFSPLQLTPPAPAAADRHLAALLPSSLTPANPALVDPHNDHSSLDLRARSYLHTNCSSCHRFNGGGSANLLLNFERPLQDAKLLDEKPVQGDFALPDARVIAPGDPERSVLLYRLATEGSGHMPYLGSRLVDERGLLLVRNWIAGLIPDQVSVSPAAAAQRGRERAALSTFRRGDTTVLPTLLSSSSGAFGVTLALSEGTLPPQARSAAIAQGAGFTDPLRRELFERFLPDDQRRRVLGSTFDRAALLARSGDATRGRAVFSAMCVACHRLGDTGIDFGPDLARIGAKWDRAGLLEQIVAPSAVVDDDWRLVTIELKSGGSRSGFVTARNGDAVTLRLTGGLTETISRTQIAKLSGTRTSIMPENLLQTLTAAEAADLLEFLARLN